MAELRPSDPARSSLLAPHATFRAHFPGGRPHSLPGPGCKGAVTVWLCSCVPLWRRSRRQSPGHRTPSLPARTADNCVDDEYRQRLDESFRYLILPMEPAPFNMSVCVAGLAGAAAIAGFAQANLAWLLGGWSVSLEDSQRRWSELKEALNQHPRCEKIPIELLKHPYYGDLAKQGFEQNVSAELLDEYFEEIVPPLLGDPELQSFSLPVLQGKISKRRLFRLIGLVLDPLIGKGLPIVSDFAYTPLPDHWSAEQAEQIMTLLERSNKHVKNLTLHFLHERIPGESLLQHWNDALSSLFVQFAFFSGEDLCEHCKQFVALMVSILPLLSGSSQLKNLALKLLCKLPATSLAQHRQLIASCHDKDSNTWLHIAAAEGKLQACEILVDIVGLPLHARNYAGLQPLALAESYEVAHFLRSRMHFRETRFGHGNAFAEMMKDERLVSEVVWHTIPLPGLAGKFRGLHSFLEVKVGGGAKRYVLEKAGSAPMEAHQKHGVFIGSDDLGTNLLSADGVDTYSKELRLSSGSLKSGLKMKDLYEQAHSTGPYDLATSNCHHAARLVFNHCCAREADRVATTPNELVAFVAGKLQLDLLDSRSFGSETSGSESASVESELTSSALRAAPQGFTKAFDVSSDPLAFVAAALSHAVYDENPASILKPRRTAAYAVIHSALEQPVHVQDSLVEAGGSRIFEGREKAVVNIREDGIFQTTLAKNQPIWMGHEYDLTRDFRGEVIVQEVAMPRVKVLHTVHAGNSVSPVEWLLARSGDVIYLCFRGTDDVQDAVIDLNVLPDFHRFKEYGIGVHGGIAHALEQQGDRVCHVVSDVLQALQKRRRPGEPLVLCGHSLGGGYAQVMAVHLLSREEDVAAVRTFGAPHVFVPARRKTSPLWKQLCSISQHWVRDWDPVPRLPLCKTWLTEVLPKLKLELEGIRVGIAKTLLRAIQQDYNGANPPLLEGFDVAGEVVLVSTAPISAHVAPEGGPSQKDFLSEKPPEASMTLNKLNAYHDMKAYLQIARLLTGPEAA